MLRTKDRLNRILAENTGKDIDTIARDTDRDNWMSADEAVAYGLVDRVADQTRLKGVVVNLMAIPKNTLINTFAVTGGINSCIFSMPND